MAGPVESEVIKKLAAMPLLWERIVDRDIWRSETQNFSIVLDFGSTETYYIYFKKKGDEDVKKITCSGYAGGDNWNTLKSLRDQVRASQIKRAEVWLDEFLKEDVPKPRAEQTAGNHLPDDDNLDNNRSD
jgi:hypothetical protein